MTTYGLLIFPGVQELDFVGPWEVLAGSARARAEDDGEDNPPDTLVTIAERPDVVVCRNGLRVMPDHTFDSHPKLDVVLIPGGSVSRQAGNTVLLHWVRETAERAQWVTSVCVGAFLLHAAGPARNRRVATDREYEDELEALGDVTVVRDARYVVDGNVVTSQGVSAGIDMALWLIGRLHGREHSRHVRQKIQYEPAPPYLADEPLG